VFVIDELPAAAALETAERSGVVVQRRLTTGDTYRAVKVLYEPDDLRRGLAALGWEADVRTVGRRFFCATVRTPAIERMAPDAPRAARILRSYYADVVGRYHGRPASASEVDAAMREEPSDDLAPPAGLLLVAHHDGAELGCAGLRLLGDGIAELTRVFVVPGARGRGLGSRLLRELENEARHLGVEVLRLDTRGDLVEARRLYRRHGYAEVAPFNDEPYAEHWFAKRLTAAEP
jgi:ribosomal protein S18 acetylase RimI-like enzyme